MKEKILDCGCHKINSEGYLFSCLKQFSQKGKMGIQTIKINNWKLIKGTITTRGYIQVNIHGKIWRLNRLIAINFIENPKGYLEVHHKNDNKIDNRIENLEWGDAKMNASDRDRNGNTLRGERSPVAKINNKIAMAIYNSNESLLKTAKKYKVSKKLVLLIKQKRIWKHIH